MSSRATFSFLGFAATTASLQAHPGHSAFSNGATHFLSSPAHALPALIFSGAVIVAASFLKHRGERSIFTILGVLIAAAAVVS